MCSHICSFLLMRLVTWLHAICIWLDWIDHRRLIIDYELIHTWYPHTTNKSTVQWISIHLCDCTCLNVMCVYSIAWWSNPKRFLSILFVSGSDFCLFGCESFSQNVKFFVLKKFVFSHFTTTFASGSKSQDFLDISIS